MRAGPAYLHGFAALIAAYDAIFMASRGDVLGAAGWIACALVLISRTAKP